MKKRKLFPIIGLLLLFGCAETPLPNPQPFPIFDFEVSDIDESGITATISIVNPGTEAIQSFGFLIGLEESFSITNENSFTFNETLNTNFTTRIAVTIRLDELYFARAYVIQADQTVYSDAVLVRIEEAAPAE